MNFQATEDKINEPVILNLVSAEVQRYRDAEIQRMR